jgi:hypothetical protein
MATYSISLLRLLLIAFAVSWAAPAHAERWQEHRSVALRALEEVDYAKAIEQLQAAIYYAREEAAADRDVADLWENLTAIYLADQQYRRAWDTIAGWDKILTANAGQPWAAEQQARRDQMTRMLFQVTRRERGEGATAQSRETGTQAGVENGAPENGAENGASPDAAADPPAADGVLGALAPAAAPIRETPANGVNGAAGYGIHLASYGDEADARDGWAALQSRYPDLLGGKRLALKAVSLGDRGTFVRLMAVPYADSAAAGAACADLQRRAQYCVVRQAE